MLKEYSVIAAAAACFLGSCLAADAAQNLVQDGGFEEVRREPLFSSPYLENAVKAGLALTREGEDAILPVNFDQFCGTVQVLKVVEGKPGGMVHSGKRALLLKGGVFLNKAAPQSYDTKEGDMYHVEFYAKGRGDVTMWFTVWGTGKMGATRVESKGKAVPSQWTKIEQTFLIVGEGAKSIAPRLAATQEVLIDDIVISKMSNEGDATAAGQAASPLERCKAAFVYPLKTTATPVGIDDPAWKDIPEFSGFLYYGEQSLLAEPPTTMKLGYDAANLYARITCVEPDMSILSLLDQYKDITTRQYIQPTTVEFFVDPGCSRLSYCQFCATARGHKFQASSKKEGEWNASWNVKTRVEANGYTLLLRIPFASLDVPRPAVGDVWGLNVCRNRDTFHSTWSPVGGYFNNVGSFGRLVFGSFEQWYGEAFVAQTKQMRGKILDRARKLGMADIEERVDLVDAYAAEVKVEMEKGKSAGLKDWREIARLYGMGGFVLDSYRRILTCTDWAALDDNTPNENGR